MACGLLQKLTSDGRKFHLPRQYRHQDNQHPIIKRDFQLMQSAAPDAVHVWLVLMKAFRAIAKYSMAGAEEADLCDSDFRVLEVLLHKGPMPVNTIGPRVDLTPGSISVAVERLYGKGLVTRTESADDRRVRLVALTDSGKNLIVPLFRQHAAAIRKLFSGLSKEELAGLEAALKNVGKRAEQRHDRSEDARSDNEGSATTERRNAR